MYEVPKYLFLVHCALNVPLVEKYNPAVFAVYNSSMCHRQFAERNDDGAKAMTQIFLSFLSSMCTVYPKRH